MFTRTFAVGLKFKYWKSDYGEGSFVCAKYSNLKDEILNNKIYNLQSNQFIISLHKVNKYFHSKKVKQMTCCFDWGIYDIEAGDIISLSHLLSICIYCDWSNLCTKFRETFRKHKLYETKQSVIKRNKEFANMAKLINETIECYGRDDHDPDTFFCGMSLMVLPQFDMDLHCPTSTSKTLEISEMFSGDNGIIIQFNSYNNSTFCTSWLSNYSSEDEWIFMSV